MPQSLHSPPNMASRTSTLVADLGGSFLGVHLATGLCRLFLSVGQNTNYLYQFILCSSLTASLTALILYYATEYQAVRDSSLPSTTRPPLVSKSDGFGERHQIQQPNPDSLTSHQKHLLDLFATTDVNESKPSAESHPNLDRILEDTRRLIEETPALVVDEQPHIPSSHAEYSPPDPKTATNKGKKNKKPKACHLSSNTSNY